MPPLRAVSIVVALMALAGCQKQNAAPAASTAGAAAVAGKAVTAEKNSAGTSDAGKAGQENKPALDLGQFRIVSVQLGNAVDAERRIEKEKGVFAAKDTLYAAVLSTGKHQGLKLSAQWTGPNAAPIASSEQALVPASPTVTTFSLRNPNGWPPGDYQVVIAINGQAMETKKFEVR